MLIKEVPIVNEKFDVLHILNKLKEIKEVQPLDLEIQPPKLEKPRFGISYRNAT